MAGYDVVVIGAGISGIGFAKTYLDIHPDCRLVIFERDTDIGGVWNERRSYDSFWTQWTVGCAEFSDKPMIRPPEEDLYYEFFKAKWTTQYLLEYVDQHSYQGKTIRDRVHLCTEVLCVSRDKLGWEVNIRDRESGDLSSYVTSKLVIASGLNSVPKMPKLPQQGIFEGKILHQDAFGTSDILIDPDIQDIIVLGGGKSSADMVYSAVKAGKKVSWILKRNDTRGPGFFLAPQGKGPYKNAFEIAMTRFASTFTPSVLNADNWWTWLLHSTTIGVKLMTAFWRTVDNDARKAADYDLRQGLQGFSNLSPHTEIFWQNSTGGLLNQKDFFDTVAQNVRIYCEEISCLEQRQVTLKNGVSVPADVILCGTGWKSSLGFLSEDARVKLGFPHITHKRTGSVDQLDGQWVALEDEADKKVLQKFPRLAEPPMHYSPSHLETPYRLYRHIIPVQDANEPRSLAVIGHVGVGNYFPVVECQSLWATAYFDHKLNPPRVDTQMQTIALFNAWCGRRYLSRGSEGNNMTFELLGYVDSLLQDLGLASHRRGWLKDYFSPTTAQTLRGLKAEYVSKYAS